jgi:putative ABC transport system permease protein
VEWRVFGDEGWRRDKIAAIYREPAEQGASVTRDYYEKAGKTFAPTAILTKERVERNPAGVDSMLTAADMRSGWDDLTEAMYTMVYLLIAAAVVLAVVVLYNLGLLSFTEMERDMATLKVMGMKSRKLRALLLTQNIWFSIIGFVFGIPAGVWLIAELLRFSGDEFDFPLRLHAANVVLSFVITFGLSVFSNRLFSSKIKKLNMAEALKSIE